MILFDWLRLRYIRWDRHRRTRLSNYWGADALVGIQADRARTVECRDVDIAPWLAIIGLKDEPRKAFDERLEHEYDYE